MLLRHHKRLLTIYLSCIGFIFVVVILDLMYHRELAWSTILIFILISLAVHIMYLIASNVMTATGESERRYQNLVDHSPDAIAVHQEGVIVFANPACAALMGIRDCKELIGMPILQFVPPHYANIVQNRARSAMYEQKVGQLEEQFVRLDGKIIDVDVTAIGIPYMGKPAVLIISRENGQRKEIERKLTETNAHYRKLSALDGLTGIPNRRSFDEDLITIWEQQHNNNSLCLIFIDVDNFKEYNDYYGHQAGDLCLQLIANRLDQEASKFDGSAYRYGGEEFAILVPALIIEQPHIAADKLRESISISLIPHLGLGDEAVVTISVGVVSKEWGPFDQLDAFVRSADLALYEAKKQGRNSTITAKQIASL